MQDSSQSLTQDQLPTKVCKGCNETKTLDNYRGQRRVTKAGKEYIYYPPRCLQCLRSNQRSKAAARKLQPIPPHVPIFINGEPGDQTIDYSYKEDDTLVF